MKTDTIKHSFSGRLFKSATCIFGLCLLMFVGAMPLSAQVYSTARGESYGASYGNPYNNAYATQETQHNYNTYQSTVYQPFGTSAPSQGRPAYVSSGVGTYSPISGRRNTDGMPSTGGSNPNNPAIGDVVELPNEPEGETGAPDGFLTPDDPGHQSNQSPVGEAWVMLLFAAVAALVVYIRRRRFSLEDTPETPQR